MTDSTTPNSPLHALGKKRRLSTAFRDAFRGIGHLVASERNARIHALATVACVIAGIILRISTLEWAIVAFAIGSVWSAEAINAAIERLADAVFPDFHPLVKNCKDLAAAAVLIATIAAVAIGMAIFAPRLFAMVFPDG